MFNRMSRLVYAGMLQYKYCACCTYLDTWKAIVFMCFTTTERGADIPVASRPARPGRPWWLLHSIHYVGHCVGLLMTYPPQPRDFVGNSSDCAVCTSGYRKGVGNTCHSCNDANTPVLIVAGTLFMLVVLLLLVVAVMFLIGGLDAIDTVHLSFSRTFSEKGSRTDLRDALGSPVVDFVSARKTSKIGPRVKSMREMVVPRFTLASEVERCGGEDCENTRSIYWSDSGNAGGISRTHTGHAGVADEAGVELPNLASRHSLDNEDMPTPRRDQKVAVAGIPVGGKHDGTGEDVGSSDGGTSKCCGLGQKTKHWISILPLDKLKILVVVWQILAVCSSITGVEFPNSYRRFLSGIAVVNLDIGSILSASCLLPDVDFYVRLLVTTLSPLVLAAVLVLTYHLAKRRAGLGRAGVIARRAAWSRHVAAGLLLTFLVS